MRPRHSPRRILELLLAMLLVTAACGGDTNKRDSLPAPGPLPSQLQEVLERVATLRGLPAPANLRFALVSKQQAPALLDRLLTDDDRHAFANTTTLYRLLGHLRPDQDYLSVYRELTASAVVGLYSPREKTLWLVTGDGNAADLAHLPRDQELALAHELTHAVQDGAADLGAVSKRVESDLDANLAWTCAVEGDAVDIARQYGAKYLALPLGRTVILAGARAPLADVPASISRELYFPYEEGAAWVASLRSGGGSASIDALLASPPASGTAAVLHPELLAAGFVPSPAPLPRLEAALGSGWAWQSGGTFGEFGLRNYLQLRLPASQALAAAAGWRGDHYDVYVSGTEGVAVFRVRFADPTEASQFRDAQARFLGAIATSERTEGSITLTATSDGHTVARITRAAPDEVIFAIGSNDAVTARAATALAGG